MTQIRHTHRNKYKGRISNAEKQVRAKLPGKNNLNEWYYV